MSFWLYLEYPSCSKVVGIHGCPTVPSVELFIVDEGSRGRPFCQSRECQLGIRGLERVEGRTKKVLLHIPLLKIDVHGISRLCFGEALEAELARRQALKAAKAGCT